MRPVAPSSGGKTVRIYSVPFPSISESPPTLESRCANVIRPCGYSSVECGYCRGKRSHLLAPSTPDGKPVNYASSGSYGIIVDGIQCDVYERFLYCGWRRSGLHLYKPTLDNSCCPTISIRLPTSEFVPTKSQKRLLKKMERLCAPPVVSKSPADDSQSQKRKRSKPQPQNEQYELAIKLVLASTVLETLKGHVVGTLERTEKSLSSSDQDWHGLAQFKKKSPSQLQHFEKDKSKTNLDGSKNAKPANVGNSHGDDSKSTIVAFATSVCAALAGRYEKLNRDDLSRRLFQALSQAAVPTFSEKEVSVDSFDCHQPSGQIWVRLRVNRPSNGSEGESLSSGVQRSTSNVSMADTDANSASEEPSARLGEWFRQNIGRDISTDGNRKLTVTTVPAHKSALDPDVFSLYALYQTVVHDDPDPFKGGIRSEHRPPEQMPATAFMSVSEATKHKLFSTQTESESSTAFHLSTTNSAARILRNTKWDNSPPGWAERAKNMLLKLCQNYPDHVHSVIIKHFTSFYQFLVEAPFHLEPLYDRRLRGSENINSPNIVSGTYHQHYRIDGVLIAVGVVDILPHGLSSVYLIYHPSFSHELLPLGKLAILREIEYTRDVLQKPYYYLGYYIESCRKMRYKAEYRPSQFLCPRTYRWVDAELGQSRLREAAPRHVCPLVRDDDNVVVVGGEDSEENVPTSVGEVMRKSEMDQVLSQVKMDIGVGINVTIGMLQESSQGLVRTYLEEFVTEAGSDVSRRCVVKFK